MEFTEWLRAELEKRGWDQSEFARRMESHPGTVGNVLNGNRQAGPDFCIGVARALGLPREEVFRARGWLLREPEQVVAPLAPPRAISLVERLINYPPEVRDLVLDAYEAVEEAVTQSAGLKERAQGTKNEEPSSSIMRNDDNLCRSGQKEFPDLSIFPEEDRELISQLESAYQEYLTALIKHSPVQYADAMNYAKTQAAAEMRRLQRTQHHP